MSVLAIYVSAPERIVAAAGAVLFGWALVRDHRRNGGVR